MPDENKAVVAEPADKTAAAPVQKDKSPPVTRPPKFPPAHLRRDCRALFDVSTSTYNAATCGLKGEFTVKEMGAHITNWLKTPLKKGA
jgi:hypothetical protein